MTIRQTRRGWYDVFLQSTLNNFMGVRGHGRPPGKQHQKIIIGPWIHDCGHMGLDTHTGDAAVVDLMAEHVRWFDHWLKGQDTGIAAEPPVNWCRQVGRLLSGHASLVCPI